MSLLGASKRDIFPLKFYSSDKNLVMEGFPGWFSGEDSASTAGGMGSILGQGTKKRHIVWCSQKRERERKEKQINI